MCWLNTWKLRMLSPHVVAAAREFVCDACVESVGRKHQRPAKLHEAKDFNDLVGMDGFYWSGSKGFQSSCFSLHWWGFVVSSWPTMWNPKSRPSHRYLDKFLDIMGRKSQPDLHWPSWGIHFKWMERTLEESWHRAFDIHWSLAAWPSWATWPSNQAHAVSLWSGTIHRDIARFWPCADVLLSSQELTYP